MAFIYDLSDTWNNAGISFNGIKLNATDTASASGSKLIDLQINGASKFTVGKTGAVIATGIVESTVGGFRFPDGTTQTTKATVNSVSGTGSVNGITLTGSVTNSGSLTLGGTLGNIANSQLTNSAITINGTSTPLGGSISVGTVTSVAALTLGTSGTDLASSVANGATTPVITLNVPTASATNRGALSSADWSTFNAKQAALVSGTNIKTVGGASLLGSGDVGTIGLAYGGTGATTASGARTALGLGTAAVLNAGVANGVATLDGSGTVPTSQLPGAVLGGLNYQGTWNASTNVPTLASSTGSKGYYYVVSTAGSTNLNGITDWKIGDWAVYDGTTWQKVDNTDAVSSVNGYTGAVVLTTSDVAQGTNLYFTQAAARASVSAGTGISYNSTTGVITNSAPDQTVALTGAGTTTVTGTYPNFTITSNDSTVGTVTSVAASGGTTGLTFTGSPITTAGTLTLGGTLAVANGGTGATTLTSGYVLKGNGTSAVSASVLYDDGTNTGIGTTSPSALFHISQNGGGDIGALVSQTNGGNGTTARYRATHGSGAAFNLQAGNGQVDLNVTSNHPLVLGTNATERMRILSGGNVGIGTTTPGALLDVNGNATVRGNTTLGDAVGDLTTVPDQLALEYTTDSLPTTRPALSLDFVDVGALDPRVTFTRSTTATFTGSNGLIQTAAINAPRFDYDPVTLAAKGLLIEEQRTNLLTYSEQFNNAAWVKSGVTVTADAIASPDGTVDADTLSATAATTNNIQQNVTLALSTSYRFSVFMKAGTSSQQRILLLNLSPVAEIANALVSWSGGVPTVTGGSPAFTSLDATSVGNGWYRISGSFTTTAASTTYRINLYPDFSAGTGNVYAWGAQLEAGAFATSYIPTVASQVTRSADVATMTGTNFSSWYNQSEGSFVVSYDVFATAVGQKPTAVVHDGTTSNRIYGYVNTGTPRVLVTTVGVAQTTLSTSNVSANVTNQMAFAYATSDIVVTSNGGAVVANITAIVPTVDQLGVGGFTPTAAYLNGHIRQIAYYNTRLPNAVLQGVTR
jgi:hypothetical protein